MKKHTVRVYPSQEKCPKEDQLAYQMSFLATDPVAIDVDVEEMIINRIIDNASVALASVNRRPVANARSQALSHTRTHRGATIFGLPVETQVSPEWAAWANGTAVRELDFHDTYLAADYSHPADNIPPILAVAQAHGISGSQLIRAIATAYEIQVALVKGICLHEHKKDHVAHLGVASAAGIGTLMGLDQEVIYQAIGQALHVTFATRQSRKGEISSWKAYAPAFAGKMAIEAVDRCMRGEGSPAPIYEGEDSVIAYMLGGKKAQYDVWLPESGESKRGILETYTKEHSAEYQAQALIDLAFRMREKISDFEAIESIVLSTSHHTHYVIGTGSGDPQKQDPQASRETLDHSITYIFTVALQDGEWHHVKSYLPERAQREDTVKLWHKMTTEEDPKWTERYHDKDPQNKAFGGSVTITFQDGTQLIDELALANAHSYGARPFKRENYIQKFRTMVEGVVSQQEQDRFLDQVQNLSRLSGQDLLMLNLIADQTDMKFTTSDLRGIL